MATFWTRISRSELISVLILLGFAADGYGQNFASCKDESWGIFGDTGSGKDVCKIAQDLMDHCASGGEPHVTIKPLVNVPWYNASDIRQLPDCACTAIMYNVLSVCAVCQTQGLDSFPTATKFPSMSEYGGSTCANFPGSSQTLQAKPTHGNDGKLWPNMAPQWSQDLTDETFNFQKAKDQVLASQVPSSNSTTSASPIPTAGEAAPNETQIPVTSNSSPNSGPNVGAIAGGVIGGLAFIGAIIALLFFLRRRKRRTRDVAPSDEFLKPEYYATPPLLSATNDRRESEYRDDGVEDEITPAIPHRLSWAGGLVATRRTEDEEGDMLPPFTQGTYIGPSPHEKGAPTRRRTDESDETMRTTTTNTLLLSSPTRSGPSEHV